MRNPRDGLVQAETMREMGGMGSSMCFFLDFLSWKKCAVNVLIFFSFA
jgi:hypothetical protein